MLMRSIGAGVLLVALGAAASAQPEPASLPDLPEQVEPEQRNAALVYAMAWAQAPDGFFTFARTIPAPKAMALDYSPPAAMRAQLDQHAPMLEGVSHASLLDRCDFELEREQGVSTRLDHMSFMHMTFRMLLADARRTALEGEPDASADRLAAVLGVSRHLSMDLTHVSSRVAAEAAQAACAHAAALMDGHELSDESRARLRAVLDRFDIADPFNARAATVATVELSIANSALDLRDREVERMGNTGFMGIDAIDEPVPVTLPEQRAWIDAQMERCRAWARDVIEAMDHPDEPESRLRGISQRVRRGDYGPLARNGLTSSLMPLWIAEHGAREAMGELGSRLAD